jgi:signal transduction histidine kinase
MLGPTGSARRRSEALRRLAPAAALLLVAVLIGLSLGTSWIVAGHFKDEAVTASRLYSAVFDGLNDPDPSGASSALIELGERVRELGIPLVLTDSAGRPTATANVPLDVALDDPLLLEYVGELDATNPPITHPRVRGAVHYGPVPATRILTALALLQALTIIVMVSVAVVAFRSTTGARRDRLWVAMAREAAHQMGTPLMSLQGWIEQVRSAELSPTRLAEVLSSDAERLQRVAQRFERIGNPARRDPVSLGALAERVANYYRARLPRHSHTIALDVAAPSAGPVILGDPVLLEWVFEALVKNAIDALQGRGGRIVIAARSEGNDATVRISDDGPGVPRELRRTLFEPGITTKRGGWGIGLALARRVVEESHDGSITLEPTERGTSFLMQFPLAPSAT